MILYEKFIFDQINQNFQRLIIEKFFKIKKIF